MFSSLLPLAGIALLLFSILNGPIVFWDNYGQTILPNLKWSLLLSGLLFLPTIFFIKTTRSNLTRETSLLRIFPWLIVLVFFSNWLCRSYSLFQGPSIRGEILFLGILMLFLHSFLPKKISTNIFQILLPLTIVSCILLFFEASKGRSIFSDDHATFFYRLSSLQTEFPSIPFYSPLWNAGTDARDFFATGALNLFALSSPLLYFFTIDSVYNFIIAGILFAFFPISLYLASRILGLTSKTGSIAGLLGLSLSLLWYRWSLHFGTMGFVTSATLLPLVLAWSLKILSSEKQLKLYEALLVIATTSLMLCWSLSGFVFIPIIIYSLVKLPTVFKKKFVPLIMAGLLMINIPWVIIFWNVSSVGNFLQSEESKETKSAIVSIETGVEKPIKAPQEKKIYKHRKKDITLKGVIKKLRTATQSTNPLVVFFLLPGILLFRGKQRLLLSATTLWLLFLGSVAVHLKPQLELDRMLLLLFVIGCIPTALFIEKTLEYLSTSTKKCLRLSLIPQTLCYGFLLAGPFITGSIIKNRSVIPYYFAGNEVTELVKFTSSIKNNGRILFSGCVIHEWGHGHLAPLPHYTEKPFVASSPVHNLWAYKDVIPKEYRARGNTGIDEYLNLMNITTVIAHERVWKDYFAKRSNHFQKVWSYKKFSAYKRLLYTTNYFLSGEGEILEQTKRSVTLKINSKEATIKFRWFPFVRSSDCDIQKQVVNPDFTAITLRNCPTEKPITIDSMPLKERLLK